MSVGGARRRLTLLASLAGALLTVMAGCGDMATLGVDAGSGGDPRIPRPNPTRIPTVDVARVRGWSSGAVPAPAAAYA